MVASESCVVKTEMDILVLESTVIETVATASRPPVRATVGVEG